MLGTQSVSKIQDQQQPQWIRTQLSVMFLGLRLGLGFQCHWKDKATPLHSTFQNFPAPAA